MERLNAQAAARDALERGLRAAGIDAPVLVSVPTDRPKAFVVVRRSGGAMQDALIDGAGISVDAWAETESKAYALIDAVSKVMRGLPFAGGFAMVREESIRSDYDIAAHSPRWFASYTVKTYARKE